MTSTTRIVQLALTVAVAFGLAALGAHPRVRELERRLGVTVLLSTGLPFLALGLILGLDSINVLGPRTLGDLRPAFEFGLGWIGFVVGMQFDIHKLDRMPRALGSAIAI